MLLENVNLFLVLKRILLSREHYSHLHSKYIPYSRATMKYSIYISLKNEMLKWCLLHNFSSL